jgi:hypothetical protein
MMVAGDSTLWHICDLDVTKALRIELSIGALETLGWDGFID